MGDISINSHFNPFRMSLKERRPVQLFVELRNTGQTAKKVTFLLSAGRQLALDKSGIVANAMKKIESFKPGQELAWYFDVYPKQMTQPGEQEIMIRVTEHFNDWSYVANESTKRIPLTVKD
ncbi:MAG TPA: hypothetical protein HA252_02120 [Candidatus Diapherotrites archaeon]|uniref:Uncharacterized protein n=1 Tax=Candidatus Iainarchaeum sp. TaxID=3101447 RepID=A0A7J4JJQ8_9ARCH|nr:hypothetical protein [Candidatus Diapherotrites archaeon]HIH16177.1 hypothetical protein [Candidatus Diapherotrites archaeon]